MDGEGEGEIGATEIGIGKGWSVGVGTDLGWTGLRMVCIDMIVDFECVRSVGYFVPVFLKQRGFRGRWVHELVAVCCAFILYAHLERSTLRE